jgi:hypothetical protein
MNAAWLARAGPRLSEEQLLDHFHSHTKRCSVCMPALRNLRLACTAAAVVASAAAFLGAAALLIQAAGQLAGGAGLLPSLAGAVQQGGGLVRLAAGCGVVAAVAAAVWRWCCVQIPRFYTGQRPHARNRVAGEWAPLRAAP